MKKKILFIILSIALIGGSCQKKNNDAAEQLGGDWNIEKITKASGVVDQNSMPQSVTLNACKVSKDPCDGLWVSNNGDEGTFSWTVEEKATIFTISPNESTTANQATSDLAEYKGTYDIIELTDTKFIVNKDQITLEFGK